MEDGLGTGQGGRGTGKGGGATGGGGGTVVLQGVGGAVCGLMAVCGGGRGGGGGGKGGGATRGGGARVVLRWCEVSVVLWCGMVRCRGEVSPLLHAVGTAA